MTKSIAGWFWKIVHSNWSLFHWLSWICEITTSRSPGRFQLSTAPQARRTPGGSSYRSLIRSQDLALWRNVSLTWCQSTATTRSPASRIGNSEIRLSHCSPFGRYNSIDEWNFADCRTAGCGLDDDDDEDGGFSGSGTGARDGTGLDDDDEDGGFTGSGTGAEKELVLVLVMVQLQAMNDSLASKPKPLVANFQPHVTQEHSTKKHPQRSYLAPPLAQIRSQPRYQKTVIQVPNAPAYKGGGISLQRELLGSVIDPNQSVHSESESTPPFFFSQRLLPGSLGCPSFPNCVRNPLWGPRDPGSCRSFTNLQKWQCSAKIKMKKCDNDREGKTTKGKYGW